MTQWTRLLPVRRLLTIALLVFLPLQFSWAAVASYCGHETLAAAGHFGHHQHVHQHEHQLRAESSMDAGPQVQADTASGAMHLDCGHCHGYCSAILSLTSVVPGAPSTVAPIATLNALGAAHAPTRPERPQWLSLA